MALSGWAKAGIVLGAAAGIATGVPGLVETVTGGAAAGSVPAAGLTASSTTGLGTVASSTALSSTASSAATVSATAAQTATAAKATAGISPWWPGEWLARVTPPTISFAAIGGLVGGAINTVRQRVFGAYSSA